MIPIYHRNKERHIRHRRVRSKVKGTASRPRFSVFCSNRYLYGQLIDDETGRTIASVNDLKKAKTDKKSDKVEPGTVTSAKLLGEKIASLAKAQKVKQVVFDRAGYRYTGKIKAFADGAREGGLIF